MPLRILELEKLERVVWSSESSHSMLLNQNGFVHSFGGVGEMPPEDRINSRQVHGKAIIEILKDKKYQWVSGPQKLDQDQLPEADAQLTRTIGHSVAVRTADCVPLLLGDRKRRQVAAIHAGWRGLAQCILGETVKAFVGQNILPQDIFAAIGPAISREKYEVGQEVVEAILAPQSRLGEKAALFCLSKGRLDRWHLDLPLVAVFQLLDLGILPEQIEVIQACTYTHSRWNSYRRDGRQKGLNWSWIRL